MQIKLDNIYVARLDCVPEDLFYFKIIYSRNLRKKKYYVGMKLYYGVMLDVLDDNYGCNQLWWFDENGKSCGDRHCTFRLKRVSRSKHIN